MAISSVAPAAIPEEMPILPLSFKRVDEWRFVDLTERPTPIEDQLRHELEAALPSARFRAAYPCTAREHADFREKHAAAPEEYLEAQMFGRCGAPTGGRSVAIIYRSDGTLLERPFSPELLNDITAKLTAEGRDVTAFGVTTRYVGQNVLVLMDAATPEATIDIGVPGADGKVLVTGEMLGNFVRARAVINRGEAGTEQCEPLRAQWTKYAFQCTFRPADEQAWISVTAVDRDKGWENPLVELPGIRSPSPPTTSRASASAQRASSIPETFTAALARLNRASGGKQRVTGALLTDHTFPKALLEAKALKFGVAVTHHRAPSEDWARELSHPALPVFPASPGSAMLKSISCQLRAPNRRRSSSSQALTGLGRRRLMLDLINDLDRKEESFAFETTLASRTFAQRIPSWRSHGYQVELLFLSLPSVDAALARVAARVQQGGHSIPDEVVRRRRSPSC
jgi:hypothetical protein